MVSLAHSPEGPLRRPKDATLRGRLVALVLVLLVSAVVSAAVLLVNAYTHERAALDRQISETARAMSLVVDRQIGQQRILVHALVASPAFENGDWEAFDTLARKSLRDSDSWVAVLDPEGRQLVNTRLPWGAKLPFTRPTSAGSDWSRALPDGVRVSNLLRSPVGPLVGVDIQTRLKNGAPARLVVAGSARSFSRIWAEQGFPKNWTGVVLDGRAQIVSRSRGGDSFVGRIASPNMQEMFAARARGVAETKTLDGVASVTAWSRAPGYGWSFVVAVPDSEIAEGAARSLGFGAAIGVALLTVGVSAAISMARRITGPVKTLTAAVAAWEAGEAPTLSPSGVAEIDALGRAFDQSARRLAQHQAELEQLNASLEARVAERTRELAEATETLVQAQKLEAMGRLTGGIAHDFNNLLMAVSGNLELIARRITDERLVRYLNHARQATERGAKLTAQLLAFSRKQRLEPHPVDVNALVSSSAGLLGSTLGGGVNVQTALKPDLWHALADATQLELVILNLALNARDAMPTGGRICIETSNVSLVEPPRRPEAPPPGDFVMVAVADDGSGMTVEVAARAFEPFFTTKGVGQGSGLGLPQVLGLAKQLGGGVEIDTAPGRGCTVKVYLPRSKMEPKGDAQGAPEPSARRLAGLRVLLVDDDADVRAVTSAMLADHECEVMEAASGMAALDAEAAGARYDVVLIDFAMPGLNGGETAERLRRKRPDTPIVMMSGFADLDTLAALWSGPLLHKPFTARALLAQVAVGAPGAKVVRLWPPSA